VRFPPEQRLDGYVGTRRDSKWDTVLPWMGHEGTPRDTILTSVGVMVKHKAGEEVPARFSGVEKPENQVRVAKADPTPFCGFRGLWYDLFYWLSAPQEWRHGVHSNSLGGIQCRHLP
jgi:hypothetical protein